MNWSAVILAAGAGVRMKSAKPKPLHQVSGMPMLAHVSSAVRSAGITDITVVVGAGYGDSEEFKKAAGEGARLVVQESQNGTADAVGSAADSFSTEGALLVLNADTPLLRSTTLNSLQSEHESTAAAITLVVAHSSNVKGLGRVVRSESGAVRAIVEETAASPEELEITEVNAGWYAFDSRWLRESLPMVEKSGQDEYYLTDLVRITNQSGKKVSSIAPNNPSEILGVNSRSELALAEQVMRNRQREHWMAEGVTLLDPETTYIDAAAQLSQDVTVHPNSHILGNSVINADCEIGPNSVVIDTFMESGSRLVASFAESARIGRRVSIGPFSRLRPGTVLADDVHVGNYAEIKNSEVGIGSRIGHFSYVGDADLGKGVNIGAGTVTVNYDGEGKHRTTIGDDAFIGSGSMLVAPLSIGRAGSTGAGAVVTKDVDESSTVVGVPAHPITRSESLTPPDSSMAKSDEPAEKQATRGD